MGKTLTTIVVIKNEQGEIVTQSESAGAVPYINEIEERGFRSAFHDMETAILETRKEAGEQALSAYLEGMSLKKRKKEHI
jgi:hypothetical protein